MPGPALGTVFRPVYHCQTTSQFPARWVRDRYGPRLPLFVAAACLSAGFGLIAIASRLPSVYLGCTLGGVRAISTYTVAANMPIKWLDERKGLATGIVSMMYGAVSFAAIPFVRGGLADSFQPTLFLSYRRLIRIIVAIYRYAPTPGSAQSGNNLQ